MSEHIEQLRAIRNRLSGRREELERQYQLLQDEFVNKPEHVIKALEKLRESIGELSLQIRDLEVPELIEEILGTETAAMLKLQFPNMGHDTTLRMYENLGHFQVLCIPVPIKLTLPTAGKDWDPTSPRMEVDEVRFYEFYSRMFGYFLAGFSPKNNMICWHCEGRY